MGSWLDKYFGNATTIQGVPVSTVPPTAGQVLGYDGTQLVWTDPEDPNVYTSDWHIVAGQSFTFGTDKNPIVFCSPGGGGSGECDVVTNDAVVAGHCITVNTDGTSDATHITKLSDVHGRSLQVPGAVPSYSTTVTISKAASYTWTWDDSFDRFQIV